MDVARGTAVLVAANGRGKNRLPIETVGERFPHKPNFAYSFVPLSRASRLHDKLVFLLWFSLTLAWIYQ